MAVCRFFVFGNFVRQIVAARDCEIYVAVEFAQGEESAMIVKLPSVEMGRYDIESTTVNTASRIAREPVREFK